MAMHAPYPNMLFIRKKTGFTPLEAYKPLTGFTVIELLVVVFIISIPVVALFSIISYVDRIIQKNKNTLIAYNLAREGVEIVRNFRDWSYTMNPPDRPPSNPTFPSWSAVASYPIDYITAEMPAGITIQPTKYYDRITKKKLTSTGPYYYGIDQSASQTLFLRQVFVTQVNSREYKVQSNVIWRKDNKIPNLGTPILSEFNEVKIEEHIFDWYLP